MKYDYTVKYNGKWYAAGEEVPETVSKTENVETEQEKPKRTAKK